MANYSFVSGAKFRPFSYQEMLQPLQAYTNEYNTIEESMGELSTKAGVLENLANEQTDPEAYAMYKQYANDLQEQAASLAKTGLTPSSRQGLINMKRRYSSEIVPIEQAYKTREEWNKEQRQGRLKDSSMLYDLDASTLSLDDLVKNPGMSYRSYSGNELSRQVSEAASNFARTVREDPTKWRNILGNQYYEGLKERGFRPEEVMAAIQNKPEASTELQKIVEGVVNASGIPQWNNTQAWVNAYDSARRGLWSAIGSTTSEVVSNKEQLAKKGKETPVESKKFWANPKTNVDGKTKTSEIQEKIDFINDLQNGKIDLTASAERLVPWHTTSTGTTVGGGIERYRPNQEKVDKLIKEYGISNLNELKAKLQRDIKRSAIRDFTYTLSMTKNDLMQDVLERRIQSRVMGSDNTGLKEFEDGKVGDPIKSKNLDELFSKEGTISLDYDPEVGLIIKGKNSKGKVKAAVMDTELIDDPDRNFSKRMKSIKALIDNGHYDEAAKYRDYLMYDLYALFNTIPKVESTTDSKIE